ncbi:Trp biosynthesis-associated membrane protein [Actinoplanes sp. NPDC051411]|jgi:uncharacterized membrane protein (TIGR02234 family)|uniref:Trp biosynthesis-associated membrane protein n=1 Tax=Actinoplanes sp. NPDC051411 TaxID=3155522 RepID=UPI003423C7E9
MNSRRSYASTLAACLAGSALSAYAVSRTWSLHLTPRTGMTDLRTARTGTDAAPWVIGLALVALAGTGALLATRGLVRRVLGVLLALAGAGVAAGAVYGRASVDPGSAGAGANVWPVACAAGGLIIVAGGVTAARLGHRWPAMSARYDRKPVTPAQYRPSERASDPDLAPADHRTAWDALDRGDDPTG